MGQKTTTFIRLTVTQAEGNEVLGWVVTEGDATDSWPVADSEDRPWMPPVVFSGVEPLLGRWIADRVSEHVEADPVGALYDKVFPTHPGPGYRLGYADAHRLVRQVFRDTPAPDRLANLERGLREMLESPDPPM